MAQFLMIMFAGILVISNIAMFTMYTVQYNRELTRQKDGFEAMIVHLITMESYDTAITYVEHYYHTQGIQITFFDSQGNLLYESSPNVPNDNVITLKDTSGNLLGTVYYNDKESYLGSELTSGLLIMNGFSILVFIFFLRFLYGYLNRWYKMIQMDFEQVGIEKNDFNFEDIQAISKRLKESIDTETRLKEYQKEYVKILAHDIKTPLTVIKAYLEGVKLGRIKLDESVLDEMLNEVNEIEKMIPKFMTQNIDSTVKYQNISLIIRTIANRLKDVFATKEINVLTNIDDYMMEVSYLDISRITEHLLFNAYYYNHENGNIEIKLNAKKKTLSIKDDGIGMDADTINKIKSGPYRSDKATRLHQKGSGIGLQIVFEVIQRLDLKLDIISVPEKGTEFIIKLK